MLGFDRINIEGMKEALLSMTKKKSAIVIAGGVVCALGLLLVAFYFLTNRCYEEYTVVNHIENTDASVSYEMFGDSILKYSRSGVSLVNTDGKSILNGGFEMKEPQVDHRGEYITVADVSGKKVYVYNGKDEGNVIDTNLPIVRAKVAKQGIVAVMLEDADSNVLNVYNPYSNADQLLVEIPTNISEEGYPLDFDISSDGKNIVTSYVNMEGGKPVNKIRFYNFTDVGQDKNTLVATKTMDGKIASRVEFVGDDKVAVFYDNGFSVFSNMKEPETDFEQNYKSDVRSMAFSDKYIAVVTGASDKKEKQLLNVYTVDGSDVLEENVPYDYAKMSLYDDQIVFCSNHHCNVMRMNGNAKFDCSFDKELIDVFSMENGNYVMIDAEKISEVSVG